MSTTDTADTPARKRSLSVYLLPLILFLGMAVFLGIGLFLDPKLIPSPLIGKTVPEFELQPVKGRNLGLSSTNLKGEVSLVNVFASWCVACRAEHPIFMKISREKLVPIHGLNYKDQPDDADQWLNELGDPYTRTGSDIDGLVAIDWGVYGVPETFVIDKNGTIAYKEIGPVTQKKWDEVIYPLILKLRES